MLNYLKHISAIYESIRPDLVNVASTVNVIAAIAMTVAGDTRGSWDRLCSDYERLICDIGVILSTDVLTILGRLASVAAAE